MKPDVQNTNTEQKESTSEKKKQDSGLRGNLKGELFIDRDVFFKREDVKQLLETLKRSNVYPR